MMRLHILSSILSLVFFASSIALPFKPGDSAGSPLVNEFSVLKSHRLVRRGWDDEPPATDEQVWAAACRGGTLMQAMSLSDHQAGQLYNPPQMTLQSPFQGDLRAELRTWGYSEYPSEEDDCDLSANYYGPEWGQAMEDLGIKTRIGVDHFCYFISHGDLSGNAAPIEDQSYTVNGRNYPKTNAFVRYAVNPSAGAIFVKNALNAATAFEDEFDEHIAPSDLPGLRALSDYLWAGWYQSATNKKNIKHFFSMWTSNDISISLMKRILEVHGQKDITPWPGIDFATSTVEGQALLGSPNGKRFGYFLAQHKEELGNKIIHNIKLFHTGVSRFPTMMFPAKDIETPPGGPREMNSEALVNVSKFFSEKNDVVGSNKTEWDTKRKDVVRSHVLNVVAS